VREKNFIPEVRGLPHLYLLRKGAMRNLISLTAIRRKPCPFLPRMEHLLTSYEQGNGDFYLLSVGFSLEKVHSGRRNPTPNAIFEAPKHYRDKPL
jgi:hypothetical protein